jgi:hypothetical protein
LMMMLMMLLFIVQQLVVMRIGGKFNGYGDPRIFIVCAAAASAAATATKTGGGRRGEQFAKEAHIVVLLSCDIFTPMPTTSMPMRSYLQPDYDYLHIISMG